MKVLKNHQFRSNGGKSSYDWDAILDGQIRQLGAEMQTVAERLPDKLLLGRFLRILREEADCPRCGAVGDEPCLTWRGMAFLDGTRHEERGAIRGPNVTRR